jgi:hypothetical protein
VERGLPGRLSALDFSEPALDDRGLGLVGAREDGAEDALKVSVIR